MRSVRRLVPLFLLLAAAPAWAEGDLNKIDRRIAKEPAYAGAPKYCLLVFGPEAKNRVWLVQDGDILYVDRNGSGDLTEKDKRVAVKEAKGGNRVFEVGELSRDGRTLAGLTITQMKVEQDFVGDKQEWERVKAAGPEPSVWWVRVSVERAADDRRELPKKLGYIINGDGAGMLLFADKAAYAPIIALDGPFTFALQDQKQRLIIGGKSDLQIGVGPQGTGPGSFAFLLYPNTIPEDAYPEAEIAFPAKAGEKAVTRKYMLKQRC